MAAPQMMDSSGADASDTDTEDQPADTSNGYTIELKVDSSGKMSIGVEPAAEEASEESGEAEGDDAQPVANLGEAIRVIKDIINNAGQMQDADEGAADMSSGYGKGM